MIRKMHVQSSAAGSPAQTPSGEVTLNIENERDKAEIENNEKTEREKTHPAKNNKDNLGQLMFKLRYFSEQNALRVTVVNCKGLPAREQNATSDPYVKLKLLPDKQHQVKTRVLRNTRDPVYDEDFTFFGISKDQLQVRAKLVSSDCPGTRSVGSNQWILNSEV